MFIFELAVQSIGMHKTYLYSFFFWMDLWHSIFPCFMKGFFKTSLIIIYIRMFIRIYTLIYIYTVYNLMFLVSSVRTQDLIGAASLLLDLSYITQLDQEA